MDYDTILEELEKECELLEQIEQHLCLPSRLLDSLDDVTSPSPTCTQCSTSLPDLRHVTVAMVQNLERTQATMSAKLKPPSLTRHFFRRSGSGWKSDSSVTKSDSFGWKGSGSDTGVSTKDANSKKPPRIPRRVSSNSSVRVHNGSVSDPEGSVKPYSRIPHSSTGIPGLKQKNTAGQIPKPVTKHAANGHRTLTQRSLSANAVVRNNNSSKASSPQKVTTDCRRAKSQDRPLPPPPTTTRKDSPFPQAIASQKNERRHGNGACSNQRKQMLTHNGATGRSTDLSSHHSNSRSSPSRRYPHPNTDMESASRPDYVNVNGYNGVVTSQSDIKVVTTSQYGQAVTSQSIYNNNNNGTGPGITSNGQVHHPKTNTGLQYHHTHHHQNGGSGKSSPAHRPAELVLQSAHSGPGHYPGSVQNGCSTGQLGSPGALSVSSAGSGNSAAASFFARAAQKLNISKRRKKKDAPEPEPPPLPMFPTNFRSVIGDSEPPAPPKLFRNVVRSQNVAPGKVKVMLRICPVEGNSSSTNTSPGGNYLHVDTRRKQVSVLDPTAIQGYTTPSQRRPAAPRLYEFDAVFPQDDSLAEICSSSLEDILQSVVNGNDGCLFSYGHARLGKTYTMIGVDEGAQNLGVIPCALAWLFRLIDKHKERTGARFSVRVSAVEVTGRQETLKDLLCDVAREGGREQAPGVFLREDPIYGAQLEHQSELRATSAEQAAYYLDAAIAARTVPDAEEDSHNSHLLFTVHVYQYRVEKGARSQGDSHGDGFDGGRSRLHLIDLGSCSRSRDATSLTLPALGTVIHSLLEGKRQLPYRTSKLTQLLKESMGVSAKLCMIAHVSSHVHNYNETLSVIQLASKIHRTKRRIVRRFPGTSSDDSSSCDSESVRLTRRPYRPGIRMGTLCETSHSDPDYTSSSEQSCDTVIYRGGGGSLFGRSLSEDSATDNEHPPTSIPIRPRINPNKPQPRTVPNFSRSRSSGDETGSENERGGVRKSPAHDSRLSGSASNINTGISSSSPIKDPRLANKPVPSSLAKPIIPSSDVALAQLQHAKKGNASPSSSPHHVGFPQNPSVPSGYHASHTDSPYNSPKRIPQTGHSYGTGYCHDNQQTTPTNEHWIDGPMLPPAQSSPSRAAFANVTPTKSPKQFTSNSGTEQWIDGPNAPVVNPVNQEQWIDGPSAFMVRNEAPAPIAYYSSEQSKHALVKRNDSDPHSLPSVPPVQTHMVDMTPRSPRSNVLETIEESNQETNTLDNKQPRVKPFVSDWLDKHTSGAMATSGDGSKDEETRHRHHRQSRHEKLKHSGRDLLSGSSKHRSKSKSSSHSNSSSSRSPHSSPTRSAVASRSRLSGPMDKANSQIQAWVDSVTESSRASPERHPVSSPCDSFSQRHTPERVSDLNIAHCRVGNVTVDEITQDCNALIGSLDDELGGVSGRHDEANSGTPPSQRGSGGNVASDQDLSPPPTYDSIVLSERLQHTPCSTHIEDSLNDHNDNHTTKDTKLQNILNKINTDLDDSLDSDVTSDVVNGDNKEVISNLFMNNRDSIYELQMDEQLETSRSSIRNSFHSEDDAWSLGSLPTDSEEKAAIRFANLTNKALDNITVPNLIEDTDGMTYKVSTLDSGNGTQLDNSFATSEMESKHSRLDLDTSTGISTMDSYHSTSRHETSALGELIKEYSHIYEPYYEEIKPLPVKEYLNDSTVCDNSENCANLPSSPYMNGGGPASPPDLYVTHSDSSHSNNKTSSKKPSILPKPKGSSSNSSKNKSDDKSPEKVVLSFKNVTSSGSRDQHQSRSSSVHSDSQKPSPSHSSSSHPGTPSSGGRSHSAPAKSAPQPAKSSSKEDKKSKQSGSKNCSPAARPSNLQQPKTVSKIQSTVSKNSLASRLPLCNGKRSKDSTPSPTKPSTSSFKDTKSGSSGGKESKSISFKFRNKSPSPSKRDKETKGRSNAKIVDLYNLTTLHQSRSGGDSDSGNDSGIVKYDVRYLQLSPGPKRAHPRYSLSSGHGSDVSSGCGPVTTFAPPISHMTTYAPPTSRKKEQRAEHCSSSGYESMLRDSEHTGTSSSNHESTSDSGHSDKGTDAAATPKKRSSYKRSKSAPAHGGSSSGTGTPLSSRHNSPRHPSPTKRSGGAGSGFESSGSVRTRVDASARYKHEPIEIKHYDIEDVERIARRRKEELELREVAKRREKISALLAEQERLMGELHHAKRLISAPPQSWSFDLHVASQRDRDDEDFVEALQRETEILAKRVHACKARIMVVTCFDKTVTTQVQDNTVMLDL